MGKDQLYEQLHENESRSKRHQIINSIEPILRPDNSIGMRSGIPP